jgi:hypothetical protein
MTKIEDKKKLRAHGAWQIPSIIRRLLSYYLEKNLKWKKYFKIFNRFNGM